MIGPRPEGAAARRRQSGRPHRKRPGRDVQSRRGCGADHQAGHAGGSGGEQCGRRLCGGRAGSLGRPFLQTPAYPHPAGEVVGANGGEVPDRGRGPLVATQAPGEAGLPHQASRTAPGRRCATGQKWGNPPQLRRLTDAQPKTHDSKRDGIDPQHQLRWYCMPFAHLQRA